ncbi:MAG TPA: PLP-dependent aminotransferase family protein [Anaerolineae bacterium]|nr:PLP-dependent aminotransferase family protein [Anaerolineae bacterium]
MPKQATFISIAGLHLNPQADDPLYHQLYDQLRLAILNGRCPPGTRLPPSRQLSQELAVSRTTVTSAFDQLAAEGYLTSHVGRGTFVNHNLPDQWLPPAPPPTTILQTPPKLSQRSHHLTQTNPPPTTAPQPFRPGLPASDQFPFKIWGNLLAEAWSQMTPTTMAYQPPAGYQPLRQAIAHHVRLARGIHCHPDQIIITTGTQQALTLCAQLLLDPGDYAAVENPGYPSARVPLTTAGAHLYPLPVTPTGIDPATIPLQPPPRLIYVTPSHQYPLGHTMSLHRRFELLDWLAHHNAWLLEDDYDSEFRYQGAPLATLQGLDKNGRVIYIGTFSKSLYPALRLGYLILPPPLATPFRHARAHIDRGSPWLEQIVLAKFIDGGHFARHIRRLRPIYAARQQALLTAAAQHLPDYINLTPTNTGLHLVAHLPPTANDQQIATHLQQGGIIASPLARYYLHPDDPTRQQGLVLGYGAVPQPLIPAAVRRLGQLLHQTL